MLNKILRLTAILILMVSPFASAGESMPEWLLH